MPSYWTYTCIFTKLSIYVSVFLIMNFKYSLLVLLSWVGITSANATQVSVNWTECASYEVQKPEYSSTYEELGYFGIDINISADTQTEYVRRASVPLGDDGFTFTINGVAASPTLDTEENIDPDMLAPTPISGDDAFWYVIPEGTSREFVFNLDDVVPTVTGSYTWAIDYVSVASTKDTSALQQISAGAETQTPALQMSVPEPSILYCVFVALGVIALVFRRR